MDNRDIIINKIISLLMPLKNNYSEIDQITNDLINYNFNSLNDFINTYFKDLNYSDDIIELIKNLVSNNLLSKSYLTKIIDNSYSIIPFKEKSILKMDTKPLNVKEYVLNHIKENSNPEHIHINHEFVEIKFNLNKEEEPITESPIYINDDDNIYHDNIDKLRHKIIDAQLNYLNNANTFIQNIENKDEEDIYDSLIELNDIRFIQHSLSKLSNETLEKLLIFVQKKLELNKHSSIDMFIIEVIKKYLHPKML